MRKIEFYEELLRSEYGPEVLLRVLECDFKAISVPGKKQELKTGIPYPFPWKDMEEEKVILDFGEWEPTGFAYSQLDVARQELASYSKMEGALIRNNFLDLKSGWNTDKISWERNQTIQTSPNVVAFLLGNCKYVSSLSLRCFTLGDAQAGVCLVTWTLTNFVSGLTTLA